MASPSLKRCTVSGCDSPIHATELCSKHKKQQQRQRAAFIKVRPGEEWRDEHFVPDVKVKRGRNPKPQILSLDRYKADMGAAGWGADIHGNLTRLPDKPKPTYKPKDGESSNSAADHTPIGKWDAKWRRNQTQQFKAVHYAERDRAMWLRGQGVLAPRLPRTAHVPTVPLTRNPAGWGASKSGDLAGAFTSDGYKVFPRGVSKPCQCKACKESRKSRA
jgi:hypothetical protein